METNEQFGARKQTNCLGAKEIADTFLVDKHAHILKNCQSKLSEKTKGDKLHSNIFSIQSKSIKNIIPTCSNNSLEIAIRYVREKIISKGTRIINKNEIDVKSMEQFQKKFGERYKSWETIMDCILEKVRELDKRYMFDEYFGYKKVLLQCIINISLSLIIIGNDFGTASGIDNLKYQMREKYCYYKLTIGDQIRIFLGRLLPSMERVANDYKKISKLNENHTLCLQENNILISQIQTLKTAIRVLVKKIKTTDENLENKFMIQDENEKENPNIIKSKLENSRISLANMLSKQSQLEKKIEGLIDAKRRYKETIKKEMYSLINTLQFCYFMHDDWFPLLDNDLII
jgi:hypothetical protein